MTSKKFLALLDNPAGAKSSQPPSQRRLSPNGYGHGMGSRSRGRADKASSGVRTIVLQVTRSKNKWSVEYGEC